MSKESKVWLILSRSMAEIIDPDQGVGKYPDLDYQGHSVGEGGREEEEAVLDYQEPTTWLSAVLLLTIAKSPMKKSETETGR